MSRSNPEEHQGGVSPVKRFYKWKGSLEKGYFVHWDKEAEQEVIFQGAFSFLLLDELVTVTGFHEASNSGVFSNEVKDISGVLRPQIYGAKKPFAEGKWKDIKMEVAYHGGKFAFSCYGMGKIDGEWELINVLISGACTHPYIELKTNANVFGDNAIVQRTKTKEIKGKNEFFAPVFESKAIVDKEILNAAVKMDRELQAWLKGRPEVNESISEPEPENTDSEAPAYVPEAEAPETPAAEIPAEDDDDIPF